MSYRKKHVKNKIYKIKPKESILGKIWFWFTILVSVLIIAAAYFFFFYPGLQVVDIVISGNQKVATQELQSIASDIANTGLINFWKIKISTRSIFLVNVKNINNEILRQFPGIEKVSVAKKYPRNLILGITERKALGIFCASGDGNCFFIDQNGVIFDPLLNKPSDLPVIRQTAEKKDAFAGENAVRKNIMEAISKLQDNLRDKFHIDIKEAFVSSPARLDVKTNENWKIYFNIDQNSDIGMQITKLNLLLAGDITAESRKALLYIDLRPKDRAIICDNSTCGG